MVRANFHHSGGAGGGSLLPQSSHEIWAWLVELLPLGLRPYAGFVAACIGVAAALAAVGSPLIGLSRTLLSRPRTLAGQSADMGAVGELAAEADALEHDLNAFRAANKLARAPQKAHVVSSSALLLATFVLSFLATVWLLRSVSTEGGFGFVFFALGISVVNISLGLLVGIRGVRNAFHVSQIRKYLGATVSVAGSGACIYINFFAAHARDLAEQTLAYLGASYSIVDTLSGNTAISVESVSATMVVAHMEQQLLGLESTSSYLLLIAGVVAFAVAVQVGYDGFSDPYPEYGAKAAHLRKVKRQLANALERGSASDESPRQQSSKRVMAMSAAAAVLAVVGGVWWATANRDSLGTVRHTDELGCPLDGQLAGHTIILLDNSGSMRDAGIGQLAGALDRARFVTPGNGRVSLYVLPSAGVADPPLLYTRCLPGGQDDTNVKTRTTAQLFWEAFTMEVRDAVQHAAQNTQTPIVEALRSLAAEPSFQASIPRRRIMIISDMIQESGSSSFANADDVTTGIDFSNATLEVWLVSTENAPPRAITRTVWSQFARESNAQIEFH